MSWSSTDPSKLFGGTWVRIKGGFVYGCKDQSGVGNGSGTDTNSHALTVAELPDHTHSFQSSDGTWRDPTVDRAHTTTWGASYSSSGDYKINSATGQKCNGAKGQGHTHKIPYIAVYLWRRTA